MHSLLHFLEVNGVVSTVLKLAVTGLLGYLAKQVRTHVHQQRKVIEQQTRTNDLLDTKQPGGLTDVVDAVRQKGSRARTREH